MIKHEIILLDLLAHSSLFMHEIQVSFAAKKTLKCLTNSLGLRVRLKLQILMKF